MDDYRVISSNGGSGPAAGEGGSCWERMSEAHIFTEPCKNIKEVALYGGFFAGRQLITKNNVSEYIQKTYC